MFKLVCLLSLTACMHALAAPSLTVASAEARFIAGLQSGAAAFPEAADSQAWLDHSAELGRAWARHEQRQLARIREWAPIHLAEAYTEGGTVFYPFSGPDFLYAYAFFPHARTYILASREPAGAPPAVSEIPPEALPAALANLRHSLKSALDWSFFITENLKSDLRRPYLQGTLPILYLFLAQLGCDIHQVEIGAISKSGQFTGGKGAAGCAKIHFRGPHGRMQTLYYVSTDLSDSGLRGNSPLARFVEQHAPVCTFIKAPSYLMHGGGFDRIRTLITSHSRVIVQDDSGIPLRYLPPDQWRVQYFGTYQGPVELFRQHFQADLAAIYVRGAPPALPFGFGYHWQAPRSNLQVVRPR